MLDELVPQLEPELRAIAARRLRGEYECSLAPDELVSEMVIRLMKADEGISSKAQLLGYSARIARQALVDHARRKKADKREHQSVTLVTSIPDHGRIELLELDFVLNKLAEIDTDRAQLVEMRFFGGMTLQEVADAQGLSLATVKRRWEAARLWLEAELS